MKMILSCFFSGSGSPQGLPSGIIGKLLRIPKLRVLPRPVNQNCWDPSLVSLLQKHGVDM